MMMYLRYPLSLRQVEDLLFERGIDICRETVRFWWNTPTFPRCHPKPWNSYHRSTAKGTASLPQPSEGLILEIGPRVDGHLPRLSAIQTPPSCRLHLAGDFLGLRRNGSSS